MKKESLSTGDFQALTAEKKDRYRELLRTDSKKPFEEEFIRTTNLEVTLIETYGFDGIKLIFEQRNSSNYVPLGKFPTDCPWETLNKLSIEEAIDRQFYPLKNQLPTLIKTLKNRCRFIYAEQIGANWHLHFLMNMRLYDNRPHFLIYTGGSPNPNPSINEHVASYHWDIPQSLRKFYAIHDGFGTIYDANFIQSSAQISVMAKMMDPICEESNIYPDGYAFADLLEFFPDGAGNTQCFVRKKGDISLTADWDHETWELSDYQSFFSFIDQKLSIVDEE